MRHRGLRLPEGWKLLQSEGVDNFPEEEVVYMPGGMKRTLVQLLETKGQGLSGKPASEWTRHLESLHRQEAESGVILSGSPAMGNAGDRLESMVGTRPDCGLEQYETVDTEEALLRLFGGNMMLLRRRLENSPMILSYENGVIQKLWIPQVQDALMERMAMHKIRRLWNVPMTIPYHMPLDVKGCMADGDGNPLCRPAFLAVDLASGGPDAASRWEQLRFLADTGFTTVDYALLAADIPLFALREILEQYRTGVFAPPAEWLIFEFNHLTDAPSAGVAFHLAKR